MLTIPARLIIGSLPSEETIKEFMDLGHNKEQIGFIVFEVVYEGKTIYCAWAGGKVVNGSPEFTLIGRGAVESLMNLPMGSKDLVIQELKLGKTPISKKIKDCLSHLPDRSKVCFLGDMANELDGKLASNFSFVGRPIMLNNTNRQES